MFLLKYFLTNSQEGFCYYRTPAPLLTHPFPSVTMIGGEPVHLTAPRKVLGGEALPLPAVRSGVHTGHQAAAPPQIPPGRQAPPLPHPSPPRVCPGDTSSGGPGKPCSAASWGQRCGKGLTAQPTAPERKLCLKWF